MQNWFDSQYEGASGREEREGGDYLVTKNLIIETRKTIANNMRMIKRSKSNNGWDYLVTNPIINTIRITTLCIFIKTLLTCVCFSGVIWVVLFSPRLLQKFEPNGFFLCNVSTLLVWLKLFGLVCLIQTFIWPNKFREFSYPNSISVNHFIAQLSIQ